MYDFPELREPTDALWSEIAARLGDAGVSAPAALTRGAPPDKLWTDPALLLGQTCGYPLVTTLNGRVVLLATPRYTAAGCDGPFYRSAVVVRQTDRATCLADLRGRRCAVNDAASNSGMNLLRSEIACVAEGAPHFFAEMLMTGSHAASVQAVTSGRADVAAIDCVTWAQLQQLRPAETSGLHVLAWTRTSPGLPFITSAGTDAPTCRALISVLSDLATDQSLTRARAALLLDGVEVLKLSTYDAVLELERSAQDAGYPNLR